MLARYSQLLYISCFLFTTTASVEETGRAVRTNRGQGGHAYQLEKALNPITGGQAHKVNEGIPENVPENAMAPQAVYKARSGKKKVISVFYLYCNQLPRNF